MRPTLCRLSVNRGVLLAALVAFAILSTPPLAVSALAQTSPATDPLPSWNEGLAKQSIMDFVKATTDQSSPNFVAPKARIATFDQDGTLWVEHPMYSQVVYCLDRVPELVKAGQNWPMSNPSRGCCPATGRRWQSYRHRISKRSSPPRWRA